MVNKADEIKKQLDEIRTAIDAQPGRALIFWYNPEARWQRFCGLQFTYLVAAYKDADDYRALRVPGTIIRDSNRIQKILYDSVSCVRIKGGPRNNMVVIPGRLRPDEKAVPAGLDKILEYRPEMRYFFARAREGDFQFLKILCSHLREDPIQMSKVVYPPFYIRTDNLEGIRARLYGEFATMLSREAGYRSDISLDDNFKNLYKSYVVIDPATSMMFFPFSMVEGKGGVFADMDQLPGTCSIPLSALSAGDALFQVNIKVTNENTKLPRGEGIPG